MTIKQIKGFGGLRVGALESRMAHEMEHIISRHGGNPLVAPSMQERPLSHHPEALKFGEVLVSHQIDMVILLTGAGFRTLLDILQTKYGIDDLTHALRQTTVVVRGPKPAAELKSLNLQPDLQIPEPNTWRDLLLFLDTTFPQGLHGKQVAVQEYGVSNPELLAGLSQRGARVTPVPVYRWTLPDDLDPLKELLNQILAGNVPVLLVTNAVQVDHLVKVVSSKEAVEKLKTALSGMMVASIGQVASERLRQYGISVDLEPSHPKMGVLVKEASQVVHSLLAQKAQRFDQ